MLGEVDIKGRYLRREQLGSGGFARCYLVVDKTDGRRLAAKVVRRREMRDAESREKVLQEVELHSATSHENIVHLQESFEWQGEFYMIMELCPHNTLKELLKSRVRLTEFEVRYYLQQLIEGVSYLHSQGILHRDLKLGNVFLSHNMAIKIGDFGLSARIKPRQRRYTTCGTPNYIAPEILQETGHGQQVDVWAIGIIAYALLCGKPPFEAITVDQTYQRIRRGTFTYPKNIPLSTQAKSLISRLLDPLPRTRLTLSQMKTHPWLGMSALPPNMPPYTLSLPPQNNFLKQYTHEKAPKLAIHPRKISMVGTMTGQLSVSKAIKGKKMNRAMSQDKNPFRVATFGDHSTSREVSALNKGVIFNSKMKNHLRGVMTSPGISKQQSLTSTQKLTSMKSQLPKTTHYEQDSNEIICYFDMSNKYGIGFLLSNGNYGVAFNDHTCLTQLQDDQKVNATTQIHSKKYLYFDRSPTVFTELPTKLKKKADILNLCLDKLKPHKQKNVLIPFDSGVWVRSWTRWGDALVMKLSNGVLQFFWGGDVVSLRGGKWLKYRVEGEQGEAALSHAHLPHGVQRKLKIVTEFIQKQSIRRHRSP